MSVLVSVIIPVFNCDLYLEECLSSCILQTHRPLEISIFDDGSSDNSVAMIKNWRNKIQEENVKVKFIAKLEEEKGNENVLFGAGYARNRAIQNSEGEYLCILDADDVMEPRRVELQLKACLEYEESHKDKHVLVGSQFKRIPENSTPRYTAWLNTMTEEELYFHRFREMTLLHPTLFYSRKNFLELGGYANTKAEDLILFYAHLARGGELIRVNEMLLTYRYREDSITWSTSEQTLREIRVKAVENFISKSSWDTFAIWNAGKDGRAFYRFLSASNKLKVAYFMDISPKLINTTYDDHGQSSEGRKRRLVRKIPIVHFSHWKENKIKFITCVSWDKTEGKFQENIASIGAKIGVDFLPFG